MARSPFHAPDLGDLLPPFEQEDFQIPITDPSTGAPTYVDLRDLVSPPPPEPEPFLSGAVGAPQHPGMDDADVPDMSERWIVIRVPEDPNTGLRFKNRKPVTPPVTTELGGRYGMVPADEADRWQEFYGPYSYDEARQAIEDLKMVLKIMER